MGKVSAGCSETPLKSVEKLFWTWTDAGSDLHIPRSGKARKLLPGEVVTLALPCQQSPLLAALPRRQLFKSYCRFGVFEVYSSPITSSHSIQASWPPCPDTVKPDLLK